MIKIQDYPQLTAICWDRRKDEPITEEAAFALYESKWSYVDQANLTAVEQKLIADLTQTVGNGVFCV